jgi:hypothetical protein
MHLVEKQTSPIAIKVGAILLVSVVEGREGKPIGYSDDGRVILFDKDDPKSAEIKVGDTVEIVVTRLERTFLIGKKSSPSAPQSEFQSRFSEFLKMKDFEAGEGIQENSVFTWMEARHRAKNYFMDKFHPDNLSDLTQNDFEVFLYFKNNRAWTMHRQGRQLLKDMDSVRRNIDHLQDETLSVEARIRDVMRGGDLWAKGFGKNITSGILHTCDPEDQYGVWNNRSEEALDILDRKPELIYNDHGLSYCRINDELNKLKKELNTDLIMLDGFMWFISKNPKN